MDLNTLDFSALGVLIATWSDDDEDENYPQNNFALMARSSFEESDSDDENEGDLKPSNLLINHRGEVKITDFGVSAILASTSGVANTFVGTCNYMSPERIIGGNYGYKSDMWSLGLVLLECATGNFPYSSPQPGGWINVYELMETIVDQPAPRAPSDQYSPEFCSFISAWYVQKDPKDRLSANELMAHPFITKYDDVDLALYFTGAGPSLTSL
ncbi:hypothetical protein OROGR_018514 [Orobanche gracilis]